MADDITNTAIDEESVSPEAQPEAISPQNDEVTSPSEDAEAVVALPTTSNSWKWIALAGLMLTLLAWITMVYGLALSTCLGIAGLLTSIAVCWKAGKGTLRDLAITCIIASGVLLLVYALFIFGIDIALNMI